MLQCLYMNSYIDESGDTGKSKKSSKYFILTAFIIEEKYATKLQKDIKKYLRSLFKLNKKRPHYFHAYKETEQTKLNLLKIINKYEHIIKFKLIKKSDAGVNYEKEIISFIKSFEDTIINITLSKYDTRKSVNKNILNADHKINVDIQENSENSLLQVADLFSWIIFNKYEFSKDQYFKYIKSMEKQNP